MAETIPKPVTKPLSESIIIRPARLWEGKRIGQIAAKTYYDTGLTIFLSPHRAQHYSHYERGFYYRAQSRMFLPSTQSFVACEASNPDVAIGYAQFERLGDDAGYQAQIKRKDTYWLRFLAWWWVYWQKINLFLSGGDKSASPEGLELFLSYVAEEEEVHWSLPERKNRWEAMSVVVLEEYHGKGIGKMLMKKVLDMAEEEGVLVGLSASAHGVFLYKSVGFEFLAPFQHVVHGDDGGGVMLYTPKRMRKEKAV